MMAKYVVGTLDGAAASVNGTGASGSKAAATGGSAKAAAGGDGAGSYWPYAIPVLMLLAALYYQYAGGKAPAATAS